MSPSNAGAGRRVLLFPMPFQGHIGPLFRLAAVLRSHGFAITIFHFDGAAAPTEEQRRDYQFVSIPSAGEAGKKFDGSVQIILNMNAGCEASFGERLESVLAEEGAGEVACLIVDAHLLSAQQVAQRAGVPALVLRTGGAANAVTILLYPMLYDKGYLPIRGSRLEEAVPELPPHRVRDLLSIRSDDHENVRRFIDRIAEAIRTSSGIVINTFEALEQAELRRLRAELPGVPVFDVGPLHKLSPDAEFSLVSQDRSCLTWLDAQPAMSVLYVSFGSMAPMEPEQFVEVAWGLSRSGCRFLWVVRPGLVRGAERAVQLPEGFAASVHGRGMVVAWAPQQEVLEHAAVGGFWTHCGWNSVMESVCAGVPMLCWPCFGDQMGNTRYAEAVWGIGLELRGELERSRVEAGVKKIMSGGGAEGMMARAKELAAKAEQSAGEGGTSRAAVDGLVGHILSLRSGGRRSST